MRVAVLSSLVACAACAVTPPLALGPAPSTGPAPALDWERAGDEAVEVLRAYLQVDTTNPPGNEANGVRFLQGILDREGIASEVWTHEGGRVSLVARLKGEGREKPLCLMSHVDVVTAEADKWPEGKGPLSGTLDAEGMIWGRGALDMKGLGVLELQTMVWLKRLGIPLSRDVVLLAVADEEVAGIGARALAKEWDRIGCSHLLNEGGMGVKDALFEGQTAWGISVAEKGVLWVRMIASGPGGHGSTVFPGRAPVRLIDAINRLHARELKPRYYPPLYTLFRQLGDQQGGLTAFVLARPALVETFVTGRLLKEPPAQALIIDTIQVTGFSGQLEPNVVPTEVSATLDVRLLPGTTPEAMLERLKQIVDDPKVGFEVLQATPSFDSPVDDPLFRALARHAIRDPKRDVVAPALSVGFTDSMFFRPLGVRAYGFTPFEVSLDELSAIHGEGERVSADNVRKGFRSLFEAILEVTR